MLYNEMSRGNLATRLLAVFLFAILIGLALFEALPAAEGNEASFPPEQIEFFENDVLPILKNNCFKCHGGGEKINGGLRLTSRQGILEGGDSGPAVSLEYPEESYLLGAVNYDLFEMPPSGQLPPEEIAILTRWVESGLPWPPGAVELGHGSDDTGSEPAVNEQTKSFWSFQPAVRPDVPRTKNSTWVTNPIDAFILARLEDAGLSPAQPATKEALLRRAYYDLIGLPPTPKQVQEFLRDEDPLAYEKVVDKLLDSPQYGEHWGRHWLDLVRYAETNSYERDGAKPYAWRYRDYVIRSFNDDKPFDQFIIEQLAGDELEEPTPETIIATGYYRLGIWDDEPSDPLQALYDDLDDILATTGQVFLGLTVNCARCHDHKLDPFPQRDYYRLLSFFNGVTRFGVRSTESVAKNSLRPIASDSQQQRHQEEIASYEKQVRSIRRRIREIERLVREDFSPVELEDFKHEQNQVPLLESRVPELISPDTFDEYKRLKDRWAELRENRPPALAQALCVTEIGAQPRETHILVRGNPHVAGEEVSPGFPTVLGWDDPVVPAMPDDAETSGRRLVLARWLAEDKNQLTPRVLVNRVWQYHFGRGIVRSPNNFGLQGDPPTHPELLDWLASELVTGGWRLKRLHKLIMLSSTYRMSSRAYDEALAKDPRNDLFWRFDMRRLSAEEIRDSIFAVNGSLNPQMGGPSIYSKIPDEVHAGQSRPGDGWGDSSPEQRARRSIYIHIKRSLITPLLAAFDVADTDSSCPVRFSTVQPTQALTMLNSDFLNQQAGVFADFAASEAGNDPGGQVGFVLHRALQREPTGAEVARGVDLMQALEIDHGLTHQQALQQFCLVTLNLNEFTYLD